MKDIMILSVHTKMTDNEIKDCIQQMLPIVSTKQTGFCLTIAGFDSDPRDLWEIPESIKFCEKLVKLGLISALEVSTHIETLVKPSFGVNKLPGFGAIEVWLCATRQMKDAANDITDVMFRRFLAELDISNETARNILDEPSYNLNSPKVTKISDGSTRHGQRWQFQ